MTTLAAIASFAAFISTEATITVFIVAVYVCTIAGVIGVVLLENRNPVKSLAWISVLLLLPAVGLLLYLFFGRSLRNHRMISRRRRRKLLEEEAVDHVDLPSDDSSPEARRLITLVRSLTGARFYAGNTCEVFTDGAAKFDALIADIEAARHYILLQYYIFSDDTTGRRVADALCARAAAGVHVRVIYDHLGSFGTSNSFFQRMRAAGVEVQPFFKVTFPTVAKRINWRNHRKLCVIDGVTGYIGGMNIADRYVDGGPKFKRWRDAHIRVTGPAVASLHYAFAVDWNFMGCPLIEERAMPDVVPLPRKTHGADTDAGMQMVTGGPTDEWSNMSFVLLDAITNATKRVFIQTPYYLPSESLLRALQAAALARIDVRVMIPLHSDSAMLTYASRSYLAESLRAGIKIYLYTEGMLHSKVLVVDDDVSSIGSTNFDFRSLEHNFEGNMMIYSHDVNHRLRRMFMNDVAHSKRVRFSDWRRRPLATKFAESALRLLSPIL